jgi:hypothetical protein
MLVGYLEIEPVIFSGLSHNCVRVDISYNKRREGLVLSLTAGSRESSFFKAGIYHSPSAQSVIAGGWKRDNQKRASARVDLAKDEIAAKSGVVWDLIQEFIKTFELSLKETQDDNNKPR